jgi:hypothetical protein
LFAGILIVYTFSSAGYNYLKIPSDNFHFGEKLLSWQLLQDPSSAAYKTYYLIHGFKDSIPGFLGALLGDNFVSGSIIGNHIFYNLCLIAVSLPLFLIFPFGLALVMLLPVKFITALPYVCMIFLFKDDLIFKSYAKWLVIYCLFSISVYCMESTSGVPFVLSMLPLCVYGLYNYKKSAPAKDFYLTISVIFIAFAGFFIIFKDFFLNSFAFVLNFAKYNTPACGHPGFADLTNIARSRFIFVFQLAYKSPVYFMFPLFIILFVKELKSKQIKPALFVAAMMIFLAVSTSYALVRLEIGEMARAHKLAMCFIYLPIPAFLYFNRERYKKSLNFYILFIVVLLLLQIGFKFRYASDSYVGYFWPEPSFSLSPATIKDRFIPRRYALKDNDMLKEGHSRLGAAEYAEMKSLLAALEENGLKDKTFFDFTNKSVSYFYLNKIPPFPFWAYNNIIDPETDFEYAKVLAKNPPDCVLLFSKNMIWDHMNPAIKVNSMYRALLMSGKYKVLVRENQAFLIKTQEKHSFSENELIVLDNSCSMPNIKYVPDAWGMSFEHLQKHLSPLNFRFQTRVYDGNKAAVIFENPVSPAVLDFMLIEGNLASGYSVFINGKFAGRAARTKKVSLVPLDMMPSVLLGDDIREIVMVFDAAPKPDGGPLRVAFYQKNRNRELNEILAAQ